ncbi:ATP-binding protein [Shimia sp.]|uniref:hybrid sensor histidine kinase/response regulator n=1 Tax=Shimia sp. TaxID=1954381 RepID=UPI0032991AFF
MPETIAWTELSNRSRPAVFGISLIVCAGLFAVATFWQPGMIRDVLLISGVSFGVLAILQGIKTLWDRYRFRARVQVLIPLVEQCKTQQVLTLKNGKIAYANDAVTKDVEADVKGKHISAIIQRYLATADLDVTRIFATTDRNIRFQETYSTRSGTLYLSVTPHFGNLLHWDMEFKALRVEDTHQAGVPRIPMLTIGRGGTILFMNIAARALLGARKKNLSEVLGGAGADVSETNTIQTAEGERQCLVAEFEVSAGRREVYLLPTEVPAVRGGAIQFDELPVALLKVRRDGQVELANRAARVLVNQEITSTTTVGDLMEGLGRSIQDWLAEAATGHGNNHTEFLRLKREDRELFVQVSLNRVIEGDTSSLIAVLSDATELKTLEAQFVQSQKMQAIGQLAGGVAHDFNNLLTAISGHCDLLLLRHDQGDSDFGDLVQINQNANRAAALVGQLLAFSRKQNLRPEILDLRNTLADLTHLLNRLVGEKVTLILSNDPILSSIRADKRQLEQVLMNLVVNARDAMPDGGEIRIHTEIMDIELPLERDRAVVPAGKYVSVRVSDDGVGIPSDKLQKVFEPFFTTKRTGEGTGLGLSTVYGIVKQTGGYIFVDSTVGVGTFFSLLFPVFDPVESPVETVTEVKSQQGLAEKTDAVVLLVEDEAPVRSFASRALQLRGLTVLEAGSGEEALELLAIDVPHVDLFVTDVVMPGIDGPGWVHAARESYPETPVVFVSGYAEDSFSDDQARINNSVFLPKPFSLAELTEMVLARLPAP